MESPYHRKQSPSPVGEAFNATPKKHDNVDGRKQDAFEV